MSSPAKPRIAVVGGVVAGLAAAYRIETELREHQQDGELVLFERDPRCGGAAQTESLAGFTLDRGPNGWLSNEPLTQRLIDELGLGPELVRSNDSARSRYIYTRNKLYRLPDTPLKFAASGILRPWEKLRVMGELVTRPRPDDEDETIYEFGARRLGQGFAETLLDPMISGIFAGDARELSLPATFPKMREMELKYGGLFRALVAKQIERLRQRRAGSGGGPAGPAGVLTTLRGGVGRLTAELRSQLTARVYESRPVDNLTREGEMFAVWSGGEKQLFDGVVMAAPAHAAAGIIRELAPTTAIALEGIGFADVAVVCHAYHQSELEKPLEGFGHLIPRREQIRALGCLWTSSIFPEQAATGEVLLRTILGGAHDPGILELSDAELVAVAVRDTCKVLGIAIQPARSWVFRHPDGIAQYRLGHRQRVARLEQLATELPGIVFVGASYRGVALNRCVRDAYTVAPRVLGKFGIEAPTIPEGADH